MISMNSANVCSGSEMLNFSPAIARDLATFDGYITFFTMLIEISDKHYIVFLCAEIEISYTNSPNESLEN